MLVQFGRQRRPGLWRQKGESMDKVTFIRVVAGILAAFVFVILIFRMKKKAPR